MQHAPQVWQHDDRRGRGRPQGETEHLQQEVVRQAREKGPPVGRPQGAQGRVHREHRKHGQHERVRHGAGVCHGHGDPVRDHDERLGRGQHAGDAADETAARRRRQETEQREQLHSRLYQVVEFHYGMMLVSPSIYVPFFFLLPRWLIRVADK